MTRMPPPCPLTAITAWELLFDRLGVPDCARRHHHRGSRFIGDGVYGEHPFRR
jgi:hypothetical protein